MNRKLIKFLIHIISFVIAIGCFVFSYWLVETTLAYFGFTFSGWLKQIVITLLGLLLASAFGRLLINEKTMFVKMKRMLKEMSEGNFDIDTHDTGKLFRLLDDDWDDFLRQLEKTSERLKKMEELKQGFISDVSHEIRSPLTSIVGFTQLAKKEDINQKKRHYYLDNIQQESMRLSELSDSLLRLSTLEENRIIEKKAYSLDKQLEYIFSVFQVQFSDKEMHASLNVAPCLYYGNEELMYQVWQNLVSNGLRFSESGDELNIRLTTDEQRFQVSIEDSGQGMTKEESNRIFERFYKADTSRTASTGGSGLGLSIVSKILECHGDLEIAVESEKGVGTKFIISGPCASIT